MATPLNLDVFLAGHRARTGAVAPPAAVMQAPAALDVTDAPATAAAIIPVVEPGMPLPEIVALMERYAVVVERGASLAIWTGYAATTAKVDDPVQLAYGAMTKDEKAFFDWWNSGATLPTFDWKVIYKSTQGEKDKEETLAEKVSAMRMAFKNDAITKENWHGLRTMKTEFIPLVTAYVKLISAYNGIRSGMANLSQLEAQEYQTVTALRGTAEAEVNKIMAELGRLTKRMQAAKDSIQAREHALKKKLNPASKDKQTLTNVKRSARGLRVIGREMNRNDAPEGVSAGVKRTSLAAELEESEQARRRQAPQTSGSGQSMVA